MNLIMSSPHVHTTYCDGMSSVEEMVVSAIDRGFQSLGFSGHARQSFDRAYCMSESSEQGYIRDVRAIRNEYAGRIRIWLGIERDKWSCSGREPYEYVIGSVHYLKDGPEYVTVDGDQGVLQKYCINSLGGDGMQLAKKYYQELTAYICSYQPEIIGHFDIIRKNSTSNQYFSTTDPVYRKIVADALEAMADSHAVMEVNTGGMARSGLTEPFPELFILKRWHELGGEVILSSDCHLGCNIAYGYEKGLAMIREAGYDHALALGRGEALFEKYPI